MATNYLRAVRNFSRMVDLYGDLLMLNCSIRCAFQNLSGNTEAIVHDYVSQPGTHFKAQILITDCFDLLEELSNKTFTSDEMDVLFVQAHEINELLTNLREKFEISYNWEEIFEDTNYIVH